MFARKTTRIHVRMEDDMKDWEESRLKRSELWRCQDSFGAVPDFMTSLQHFQLRQKRTTDPSLSATLPPVTGPFLTFQSVHSFSESILRAVNAAATPPQPSAAHLATPPDTQDN